MIKKDLVWVVRLYTSKEVEKLKSQGQNAGWTAEEEWKAEGLIRQACRTIWKQAYVAAKN